MACFTKTQQRNRTNCDFEKYVTTINFHALKSLNKSHLNSVCTWYVCDKSEKARVCAKWQWNALDWCYWIALPASPVVQSSNTVSCISLSFRTHLCVLAINSPRYTGGDFIILYRFVRHRRCGHRGCRRLQILVHAITFEQLFGFLFSGTVVGPDL